MDEVIKTNELIRELDKLAFNAMLEFNNERASVLYRAIEELYIMQYERSGEPYYKELASIANKERQTAIKSLKLEDPKMLQETIKEQEEKREDEMHGECSNRDSEMDKAYMDMIDSEFQCKTCGESIDPTYMVCPICGNFT